jgi:hypothetical protein
MPAGLAVRELCPEQAVQVATQPLRGAKKKI